MERVNFLVPIDERLGHVVCFGQRNEDGGDSAQFQVSTLRDIACFHLPFVLFHSPREERAPRGCRPSILDPRIRHVEQSYPSQLAGA